MPPAHVLLQATSPVSEFQKLTNPISACPAHSSLTSSGILQSPLHSHFTYFDPLRTYSVSEGHVGMILLLFPMDGRVYFQLDSLCPDSRVQSWLVHPPSECLLPCGVCNGPAEEATGARNICQKMGKRPLLTRLPSLSSRFDYEAGWDPNTTGSRKEAKADPSIGTPAGQCKCDFRQGVLPQPHVPSTVGSVHLQQTFSKGWWSRGGSCPVVGGVSVSQAEWRQGAEQGKVNPSRMD